MKDDVASNFFTEAELLKFRKTFYKSVELCHKYDKPLLKPTELPVGEELFEIYNKIPVCYLIEIVIIANNYEKYKINDLPGVYRKYLGFTEAQLKEEARKINEYWRSKWQY